MRRAGGNEGNMIGGNNLPGDSKQYYRCMLCKKGRMLFPDAQHICRRCHGEMILFNRAHRAVLKDIEDFLTRVSDPDTRRRVLRRYLVIIDGAPDKGYEYIAAVIEKELTRQVIA
ncbi:MAG: hypothetical protein A4E35_02109 [Methanoregula sp. PtaU1.Bin051]|nr:MAG: hypothetical protein A4E35_02109 [Methanoregula sp. PtaU1.Bin051]